MGEALLEIIIQRFCAAKETSPDSTSHWLPVVNSQLWHDQERTGRANDWGSSEELVSMAGPAQEGQEKFGLKSSFEMKRGQEGDELPVAAVSLWAAAWHCCRGARC